MLTHRHAHKGRHTYVGNRGQRCREDSEAVLKRPTSALIRLSEEPLLPVESCPSVSSWVTGQAWLFPATYWTQQFLPGPREPEEQSFFCFFFSWTNAAVKERQTWVLTSLDVKSISTYWEASECCCSCRRCFPRLTCQRRFPPTSPFCLCGWFSDGGASDAGSSWARAHRYKRCGGL